MAWSPWGVIAGALTEGVFRLDSAEQRWVRVGLDHAVISAILYMPGDTPRVLVGVSPRSQEHTDAAVFATDDGGTNWEPWDGGLAQQYGQRFWAYSLATAPGNPSLLFMGEVAAILRSRDGGRTWQFVSGGPGLIANGVNTIAVSPQGDVWASGVDAFGWPYMEHSPDWGDSWVLLDGRRGAQVLAIDPRNPGRLWAGGLRVASSDDGGASWKIRLEEIGSTGGIVFLDSDTYVFGGSGSLVAFRSPDRGERWERLRVPPQAKRALSTAVEPSGRVLVGTAGGGIWRYTPE